MKDPREFVDMLRCVPVFRLEVLGPRGLAVGEWLLRPGRGLPHGAGGGQVLLQLGVVHPALSAGGIDIYTPP